MARIVQKFGGTSVADIACLEMVSLKVKREVEAGHQVAVVVSAMAGVTNQLAEYAHALGGGTQTAEYDVVAAAGEQITSGLLALALSRIGIPARSFLAWQLPVLTDSVHGNACVQKIDSHLIKASWLAGVLPVIAGFQGINSQGRLTTLGRGGSDTTAVALAAALKADRCDIYTDVKGIYTADPRIVPKAQKLKTIIYEEMEEFAACGAKVLQKCSVEMAKKYKVPVQVLSSFHEEGGTEVVAESAPEDSPFVRGIAHKGDEGQITLKKVYHANKAVEDILRVLSSLGVHTDMIMQDISLNNETDLTFTVLKDDIAQVINSLQQEKKIIYDNIVIDTNITKVTLVGAGLHRYVGLTTLMLKTVREIGVSSQVISCSPLGVSILVSQSRAGDVVRKLHNAYGMDKEF